MPALEISLDPDRIDFERVGFGRVTAGRHMRLDRE
jgi:hypothetical protein